MNRKTLLALATVAGLALITVIALTRPQKGETASDKARPVPKMTVADVESLEVTKNGVTSVIKNDGGKYKVAAPVAYAADEAVAKAAFEGLGKMDVSDLVTEKTEKQARDVIKAWLKSGLLFNQEYMSQTRRAKATGLKVNQSKRPT